MFKERINLSEDVLIAAAKDASFFAFTSSVVSPANVEVGMSLIRTGSFNAPVNVRATRARFFDPATSKISRKW